MWRMPHLRLVVELAGPMVPAGRAARIQRAELGLEAEETAAGQMEVERAAQGTAPTAAITPQALVTASATPVQDVPRVPAEEAEEEDRITPQRKLVAAAVLVQNLMPRMVRAVAAAEAHRPQVMLLDQLVATEGRTAAEALAEGEAARHTQAVPQAPAAKV